MKIFVVYTTYNICLNGNIDCRQPLKLGHQSSISSLPFAHLSSAVPTVDTQLEAVLDPFPAHSARLCAGSLSQAVEVDFAVVLETAFAA